MKKLILPALLLGTSLSVSAQHINREYQNILDEKTYDILVAESSGEKTMNVISDVASYEIAQRDFENLKESAYFVKKLKEYGLEDVTLNRYKGASAWTATVGKISEISPKYIKIADYNDIPASLCPGSVTTNLDSAELVWVGMASDRELEGLDLKGKVVFGEASAGMLHNACAKKGAIGVISCYGRSGSAHELLMPNMGLRVSNPTFAFQVNRREGYKLRDRLRRGEKIKVSCEIKSEVKKFEYQSPSCVIKGTKPELGELVLSAHLFEGYAKLGANDNMSGSAVLLDVARTINTLINEGKIERPLRSIRFIWGDEFFGIIPWVNEHKDLMANTLFNLNLDMVGVDLTDNQTSYVLHRNRFATSHYSSDLAETLMNYVHMTNQNSIIIGDFLKPVVALSGGNDPFVYSTTPFYWASDHSIFCDWAIDVPAVMMITWPDDFYHTSFDRVENLDATQLKRASLIASALMYTAANAEAKEAKKFATMCLGGAQRRLGQLSAKILNDLSGADINTYKTALNDLDAFFLVEEQSIKSTMELDEDSQELKEYIKNVVSNFEMQVAATKEIVYSAYKINTGKDYDQKLSADAKRASKTYYAPTAKVKEGGYGVKRQFLAELNKAENKELQDKYRTLYLGDSDNLTALTNRENFSLLDMKNIANLEDTRGKDITLADIEAYFDILVDLGALVKENR